MKRACLYRLGIIACRQRFETRDPAFRLVTAAHVKSMVGSSKSLEADGGEISKYPNMVESSSLGSASMCINDFGSCFIATDRESKTEVGGSAGKKDKVSARDLN